MIRIDNVSKQNGHQLLFIEASAALHRGEKVGLVGPNGAGKTTLFRMITGAEKPDKGTLTVGDSVKLAYVDQSRDSLPADAPLWSAISDGQDMVHLGKIMVPARAYAARFGFTGDVQQRKVGVMSGGERNRIHLARLIKAGANVLLLDEPTNDLDVDTLRSLEEGITSFAGSVVVITHDRWFLDRLATHIIAFEGDGYVHVCEGNFEVYERSRRERLGIAADEPHRFRYRKLTH